MKLTDNPQPPDQGPCYGPEGGCGVDAYSLWNEAVRQTLADVARDMEDAAKEYRARVDNPLRAKSTSAWKIAETFRRFADRYTAAAKDVK